MNSNAHIAHQSLFTLPSGWVVAGLTVLAWLPLYAAWQAFAAVSAILFG